MEWLLIGILVLNPTTGKGVPRVTIACEGEYQTGFVEVQETDSRGYFVISVQPGPHQCVAKKNGSSVLFTVDGKDVVVGFEVL